MLRLRSQSSLPDTYFQPQRVRNLKEIHFQNYSLPLTLITNLERKWIRQRYASDFNSWQQRQPNYQNLQRSLAESKKHCQDLHQLYHIRQFTIFVCSTISSKIQTDEFSSETFIRVESILSGPHPGAFCKIMAIFMSGFGN